VTHEPHHIPALHQDSKHTSKVMYIPSLFVIALAIPKGLVGGGVQSDLEWSPEKQASLSKTEINSSSRQCNIYCT